MHSAKTENKSLWLAMFASFILSLPCLSQVTISGPSCAVAGVQYTYTASGAANGSTYSWSASNGTISGSSTSLGVKITWNSGNGKATLTTSNPSGTWQLNVTTVAPLAAGTTSISSENINYNSTPQGFSCTAASGGYCTPSYTYQWQQSTNDVSFTNISGATSLNLSFSSPITQTTYYRNMVTETNTGSTAYTGAVTVFVYPQLVGGNVNSSQTINYNTAPSALTLTGVSGGTNSYTYQWYYSQDAVNWTTISAATSTSYSPPALASATYYRVTVTSNGIMANSNYASITVSPELFGGTITPSSIAVNSGTSPGFIGNATGPVGGNSSGTYSYQWLSSTNGTSFTAISGATSASYSPPAITANTWYERQVSCSGATAVSNICQATISTGTPDMNFVMTRSILKAGVPDSATAAGLTSPYDVAQVTQYFDGLGRPVQAVAMRQTPLQNDLVSFNVYDSYEREATKFLPYPATTNNGGYKPTAQADQYTFNSVQYPGEQYYYSEINFEPSPLDRPLATYAPGTSWEGSGRGVSAQHLVNQASDSVRIWTIAYPIGSIPVTSSIYPSGTLYKTITTDEAGHQVAEYKDLLGHVVLKKVQVAASPGTAHVGWLCTYYVYDDMGYLRFVIQPQAVVLIDGSWSISTGIANEMCFRYEYDAHGHMIVKKIPGAGEAHMVYDIRDRLVMSQDSLLRSQQKWLYTKYDIENRPDSTGLITDPTYYNNLTYYDTTAFKSNNFPVVASYTNELLTQTYYDDYSWASGAGMLSAINTTYTSNSTYFNTSYNTSPTYAVQITQFVVTRGMATGSRKEVIGTNGAQYLYGASFYDDRGRVIQTQDINYTGAKDTVTNQYDFTGKPIRSLLNHAKNGNTVQNHTILTLMDYDQAFRLRHIWKNIDNAASNQLIDSMQYNELGQLNAKYLGNNVDSLIYNYNVRGWLTGINKNYVAGTTNHYFGMELGYDKTSSVAPGNTYATPEYNGNIEGTVWKTAGSGLNRKYDFNYDDVNRLTAALFQQNTTGTAWDSALVSFTTSNLSYDANGNILTMNQKGFTLGGSNLIDQLAYAYQANSNKLSQVTDASNNPTSQLGDFHYTGTKGSYDYTYDGNGNLNLDNNKAISYIHYNYLNLPDSIVFTSKGYIKYIYDATGAKWQKTTIDNVASKKTVTTYIGGIVYQNTSTLTGSGTDTLQFIAHEEGRARWAYRKYTNGTTGYSYQYDFFEKDHLGDTRMVLTQERDTTNYLASMEAAYRATESQLFANIAATSYAWASVPGYSSIPSATRLAITNPNDSVSKVDYNGTTGQTSGPSLLLKVMSGDTVTIGVQSYYNTNSINTTNSSLNSVVQSLALQLLNTPGGGAEGNLAGFTSQSGTVYTGVQNFLNTNDPQIAGYPKAYLNWVFLDDQFNYVSSSSGSVAAANSGKPAGTLNTIAPGTPIAMPKNGYLYVWVSNETQGWDVFFDNLSVQYKQGPVLEENHYYPFGLTMAGISDKAIKSNYAENKIRFQKQELQNKEFSDGSGLEMYEFKYRFDDCQIGRFWSIDPLADKYVYNSTYAFSENKVTGHIELEGLEAVDPKNLPSYLRASFPDNVQKDIKNFTNHVSQAFEAKGTLGPAVGVTLKGGKNEFSANITGPQGEIKVDGTGKTDLKGSLAGANGKIETPIGDAQAGGNIGVIQYKDGNLSAQSVTGGADANLSATKEVKDGNTSENIGGNALNASLTVGAKLGIVGVQATVNVLSAGKAVLDFFKTGVDYIQNLIQEKEPVKFHQ